MSNLFKKLNLIAFIGFLASLILFVSLRWYWKVINWEIMLTFMLVTSGLYFSFLTYINQSVKICVLKVEFPGHSKDQNCDFGKSSLSVVCRNKGSAMATTGHFKIVFPASIKVIKATPHTESVTCEVCKSHTNQELIRIKCDLDAGDEERIEISIDSQVTGKTDLQYSAGSKEKSGFNGTLSLNIGSKPIT